MKGVVFVSRTKISISLSDDVIRRLDGDRGNVPRSDYIATLIKGQKVPGEVVNEKLINEVSKCTTAIKAYIAGKTDGVESLKIYDMIKMISHDIKSLSGRV